MNNKYLGIIKIYGKVHVSIFSFFAILFFMSAQGVLYSTLFLLCIALHEFSHLFFLKYYGANLCSVTIFPFGIDISADTSRISYKKELVVTLAGSASNLIFAAIGCIVLQRLPSPPLLFFVMCNLFLGCMNLIPLSFFDGGKAIRLILYDRLDIDKAFYIQRLLDIFSSLLFLGFALFVMSGSRFNLSVVCVVIYASVSTLALYIKPPCRQP